ncbi:MAG TPA: nitroreductase/quinone reductase family protein [Candidatus Dormibacteraeota bacterium]|nr:nitroreductase/quinone reductase family protein [Candidatus Dormibacteraeota bacterium]
MSSNTGRPQIPQDMKSFNDKVIAEHRANRGQLSGQLAQSKILLLTTTGAKSGKQRTTVVGYRRDGDRYVAIASNNGNDVAPKWFGNLLKHPEATIEVGPEKFEVRARVATAEERPVFAKLIDYLERQQALTSREIPVVVLEPI